MILLNFFAIPKKYLIFVLWHCIALLAACMTSKTYSSIELNEIVVQSDLRRSSLFETAASLSVLDNKTIELREAKHLENLINLIPNVNFSSGASRGRFFQIRGIGERSQFIEPLNPSVGLLIDGIDFTGIAGAATTMDLEQVEIFRGPQGTIYGANALAGLISLKSKQPTENAEGNILLSAGRFDTRSIEMAVGGTMNDETAYRLALLKHSSDGYTGNEFLQRDDTDNIDEKSMRAIVQWQPTDAFTSKFTLFFAQVDNGYDSFSLDNTRVTLSDKPGHDRQKSEALAIDNKWSIKDGFDLFALLSHAETDSEYGYDEDWAFPDICVGLSCEGWEYSSEDNYMRDRTNSALDIKLVSKRPILVFGGSYNWIIGAYLRRQDERLLRQYTYEPMDFSSDFDTKNRAIYGEVSTEYENDLSLSFGARLETRDADYNDSDLVRHHISEDFWGGRISLSYKYSEDIMLYGLISRGYKAGGVNSEPFLELEDRAFDTELMWNFELGMKGIWMNGRLQGQLSAFNQKRKDIQIKQSLVQTREGSYASDFVDFIGNSAQGSNYGLELETIWMVTSRLSVFINLGLLKTKYDIPEAKLLNRREQAHAPNYQFYIGAEYILNENLSLNLEIEGKDEFYLSSSHQERSDSYELFNIKLNYGFDRWDVSFWIRNLTDKDVIVRGFGGFGNDPRKFYATEPYYQYGEPKSLGFSARYEF